MGGGGEIVARGMPEDIVKAAMLLHRAVFKAGAGAGEQAEEGAAGGGVIRQ